MSTFYTHVAVSGDSILYRGVEDGKRVSRREEYFPTLYVPSKKPGTEFKTIHEEPVEPIQPGTIRECRDFVNKYQGVSGFRIFGNTNYGLAFLSEKFPDDVSWDLSAIKIATLDIETEVEQGFPNIDNPQERINVITIRDGDTITTFCLGRADVKIDGFEVTVHCFEDEVSLLTSFLNYWDELRPDILTGFNVKFFDVPYLIARLSTVLGEKEAKKISPWRMIRRKTIEKWGNEHTVYEITGVSVIDYLEIYRKYTFVNLESYKLDHIASIELGNQKIDYHEEGFESFRDFYTRGFQRFVEYNIQDVNLVYDLERKLRLIELHTTLAYMAKVNFEDVFSQVRTWDSLIINHLLKEKTVAPLQVEHTKNSQYAGAFVKEPQVGFHKWIVSFDLTSLYPHLIMGYNISPDTIMDVEDVESKYKVRISAKIEDLLSRKTDLSPLKKYNLCMTANGQFFQRTKRGFLPKLMEDMFNERKAAKKKMLDLQQEIEIIKAEITKRGS